MRRRGLLAAAVATLVLAGCTPAEDDRAGGEADDGPSPTATTTTPVEATPAPPVPRAGACYRLTLRQAARPTNDNPAIPCDKGHTARTLHVGALDLLVDGHSLAVDSTRAQRQIRATCPRELDEFLGGDAERRALSRFQVIWFSPTLEESDLGADWFRCDVIALGKGSRLLPLPREERLRGVLDRPGALATFGLCGTAQPGADDFERVACALPHSWVAVSTITIAGDDTYPGVAAAREAGEETCADRVREANDFVLEYRYGWEWPTREQWRSGQRYGICWAPQELA